MRLPLSIRVWIFFCGAIRIAIRSLRLGAGAAGLGREREGGGYSGVRGGGANDHPLEGGLAGELGVHQQFPRLAAEGSGNPGYNVHRRR